MRKNWIRTMNTSGIGLATILAIGGLGSGSLTYAQDAQGVTSPIQQLTVKGIQESQEGSEIPLEEKDLDTPEKKLAEIDRLTKMINAYLMNFEGNQIRYFSPKDLEYNDPLSQRQRLIWRYYEDDPASEKAAILMDERWRLMTTKLKKHGFVLSETFEVQKNDAISDQLRATAAYWRTYSSIVSAIQSPMSKPAQLEKQAAKFIDKYPDDPRGASLLGYIVLRLGRFPDEQLELYRRIGREYPDAFMGQIGKGKGRQVDEIGKPFAIEFDDVRTGTHYSIEDWRGHVVVVDFMSTFCRPCMAELPELMNLKKSLADEGVVFVAVSLDRTEERGGKNAILGMLDETKLDWPVFYQGMAFQSPFSRDWGISKIPVQFVIDQEGNLRSSNAGIALEAVVNGLLEEEKEKNEK